MTDQRHRDAAPEIADEAAFARRTEQVGTRVAGSAAMLWATNMAMRLLQLVTTAVLARLLTPADYGVVALATMVTGLLDVLSNLQVGGSIIRTGRLEKAHLDTAFTLDLARGAATALLLVAFAVPAAHALREPRLVPIFYVLSASSLISGLMNPYFILFERDLDFRRESVRLFLASAIGAVVGISGAIVFRNYWALIAANVAATVLNVAFSYVGTRSRPGLSLARVRELFGFGSWFVLINVLNYINSRIDYTLIGRNLGPRALGAYHVGQQTIMSTTGDMVGPLGRAIFPAFALMADDRERLRRSYRRAQSLILALSLPIGFGVSALSHEIILLLVGRQWLAAVPVVRILAPLIALQTVNAGVDGLAYALGRTRALFVRTLCFLGVRAGAMIVGYWLDGFMGIVYGRVVSGTFMLVYGMALGADMAGISLLNPVAVSWRSLVSVALMVAALAPLGHPATSGIAILALVIAGKIALGVAVYAGAHLALWKLAGSPEGAETSLVERAVPLLRSVRARIRPAPRDPTSSNADETVGSRP